MPFNCPVLGLVFFFCGAARQAVVLIAGILCQNTGSGHATLLLTWLPCGAPGKASEDGRVGDPGGTSGPWL